jgi:tellurite resistance protein TerC
VFVNSFLSILSIIVQLVFLEGILSIDNAAVLGAMVSVLPTDKPTPFPPALRFLQRFTDRVLGMQQQAALKVGLLGAYVGRGAMLVLASWVIGSPLLRVLGAAYLIKLAFGELGQAEPGEEAAYALRQSREQAFWLVVLNVELADLTFSLDNVVAAVSLSNQLWVILIGVFLGILTMRFAASIFTWAIKREPILATGAYIVVLAIGIELLLNEFWGVEFASWQKFAISAGILVLCVVYARLRFLHFLAPLFRWLAEGMGTLNELVEWLVRPMTASFKRVFSRVRNPTSQPIADSSPDEATAENQLPAAVPAGDSVRP